jgi:hypothetical protein
MYGELSKLGSRGTYSKNVPELLNNVPFVWLNFIVLELYLACVGNLVDHILVFVGELEHIKGGIPVSTDITGHYAWFERELLQNTEPLRESLGVTAGSLVYWEPSMDRVVTRVENGDGAAESFREAQP